MFCVIKPVRLVEAQDFRMGTTRAFQLCSTTDPKPLCPWREAKQTSQAPEGRKEQCIAQIKST